MYAFSCCLFSVEQLEKIAWPIVPQVNIETCYKFNLASKTIPISLFSANSFYSLQMWEIREITDDRAVHACVR